jgi:hypothetical protein
MALGFFEVLPLSYILKNPRSTSAFLLILCDPMCGQKTLVGEFKFIEPHLKPSPRHPKTKIF